MAEQNNNEWVNVLCDKIAELLADPKKVHFNTHKNRKAFTGNIVGMIKDEVEKNTTPKHINNRRQESMITRPNPNKAQGFAIMTEGLSSKGDEVLGVGPGNEKPKSQVEKNGEQAKRGVHIW